MAKAQFKASAVENAARKRLNEIETKRKTKHQEAIATYKKKFVLFPWPHFKELTHEEAEAAYSAAGWEDDNGKQMTEHSFNVLERETSVIWNLANAALGPDGTGFVELTEEECRWLKL